MSKLKNIIYWIVIISCFIGIEFASAQSSLPCGICHSSQKDLWLTSRHANTQNDVAVELAANWQGQTPDSVINGSAAENCVACHSPIAVTTNSGMTEVQVMGHYFTTTGGLYTDSTHTADTSTWPHLWCTSCHNVPMDHPVNLPTISIFNSTTAHYDSITNSSALCGQCHGTLRFAETDHRIYDAWKLSRHGHRGQTDVASELAAAWSGKTPDDVINGPDAENCIACHAPTAVKPKYGDTTEVMVLNRFFSTTGGVFTESTTVADTSHWPDLACASCHNPHRPDTLSYYNSSTRTYQYMSSSSQLCGQCHGNLRFPGTDHMSYNIESGTGGIGVPDGITMPGTECVSCHMHKGEVDGTNSLFYGGHGWSVFIHEPDGSTSAACTSCHLSMNADSAMGQVERWKADFTQLDSIAQFKVAEADTFMQSNSDSLKLVYLAEAHNNLSFAESDESGGFHNHNYSVALLNDAIAKADLIITGVEEPPTNLPLRFELAQNYPNPFNPITQIHYSLPINCWVTMKVFNILGQEVALLANGMQVAGYKSVNFNAANLPSGIYIYKLNAGTFTDVKKMLLVR